MTDQTDTSSGWLGIAVVWAIALIGSIVIVTLAYSGTAAWFGDASRLGVYGALGIVLAASVIGALIVQLATRRPEGFVLRVSWSITGAAAIVAIAGLVVAPIATA
ncbi:hypothetical protein BJY17_001526 [Agromyces hippuratus]|uniref:Major facilitator superfamily (MFS) profile domain-containing protein n=1 Tax=Agromyces hippuratus TaxID=286438 RepID=A0A852WS55_9MICO|nr:hypothetical protein [Agromyces hippuratus]NYG20779.1 hypothetical protein [Agromyces hippuratus]